MNRIVSEIGRRPGTAMLESACIVTAGVVHTVAAVGLTVGVLAVSALRRGSARRAAGATGSHS